MIGLIYQATYRFFTVFCSSLNKGEKDQPPPPEVEREHLQREIKRLDDKIKEHAAMLERMRDGKS